MISFYTLEHIPREEHATILRRVYQWLRAGGFLLISMEADDFDDVTGEWLGVPMFISCFEPETMQRMAALRFTDPRVQALLSAVVAFRLLPQGFTNPDLRALLAPLLGLLPDQLTAGQMTYHLRRLRLHGLIERQPNTHRYQVTEFGWRVALFFTRTHARVIRPGLAHIVPAAVPMNHVLRRQFDQLETAIDDWLAQANLTQ